MRCYGITLFLCDYPLNVCPMLLGFSRKYCHYCFEDLATVSMHLLRRRHVQLPFSSIRASVSTASTGSSGTLTLDRIIMETCNRCNPFWQHWYLTDWTVFCVHYHWHKVVDAFFCSYQALNHMWGWYSDILQPLRVSFK